MSVQNDGGAAFPCSGFYGGDDGPAENDTVPQAGMSLRDWMAATISHDSLPSFQTFKAACEWSGLEMPNDNLGMIAFSLNMEARMRYAMADAMLIERERKPNANPDRPA